MSTLEIKTFKVLREKLGEEATVLLMEYISTKKARILTEERLRQIFTMKEDLAKFETKVETRISLLEIRIEAGFNSQLKWLILLMLGFSSLIITVIKLL